MTKLSITGQISELEYTIEAMAKWHAHEINARHIKAAVAELHAENLSSVLATLRWFQRNEAKIRAAFQREASNAQDGQGVDRRDA